MNQKITTGSSSSKITSLASPESADMKLRTVLLIHVDCSLKWSILLKNQMHCVLKRVMIAWSFKMHNAQFKKHLKTMTCMMEIQTWAKYFIKFFFSIKLFINAFCIGSTRSKWKSLLSISGSFNISGIIQQLSMHSKHRLNTLTVHIISCSVYYSNYLACRINVDCLLGASQHGTNM